MAKKTYWEKLKDPRWQRLRLEAMLAADFSCESCGESESPLNVHHKEYFKDHEPWDYEIKQLSVLCEDCHEIEHYFDFLKWACSYARINGPKSRRDLAFVVGAYVGLPYKGMLSISQSDDIPYFRELYRLGSLVEEAASDVALKALKKKVGKK